MPDAVPPNRRTFPPKLADLGFSIDVPDGFMEPPLPQDETDFNNPTVSAPLTLLASPVAAAILTVAARPAYSDGTVMEWMTFLTEHFKLNVTGMMPGEVGDGVHPAILFEGNQTQEETLLRFNIAALEDGGRFVTVHAMCPEVLWPSFGPALTKAVASFTLTSPKGPTVALVPGADVPKLGKPAK